MLQYNFCNFFQTFYEAFCGRQKSCEGTTGRYWGPSPILHLLGYDGTSPDSHHITGLLWIRTRRHWPQPSIWTGDALRCKYSYIRIRQPHAWDNLTVTLHCHHRFCIHMASKVSDTESPTNTTVITHQYWYHCSQLLMSFQHTISDSYQAWSNSLFSTVMFAISWSKSTGIMFMQVKSSSSHLRIMINFCSRTEPR